MCRLSWNLWASNSWNPQSLSRPVMGLLHLYRYCQFCFDTRSTCPRISHHGIPQYVQLSQELLTARCVNLTPWILSEIINFELHHTIMSSYCVKYWNINTKSSSIKLWKLTGLKFAPKYLPACTGFSSFDDGHSTVINGLEFSYVTSKSRHVRTRFEGKIILLFIESFSGWGQK